VAKKSRYFAKTERKAAASDKWRRVNRVQLAEAMGVHPDTISDYTRLGMPVLSQGGAGKESTYDLVDCLEWWRDNQGGNAKDRAQTRALNASAKLNELKLLRETGELFTREQIALEGQAYTKAWASMVRSLPKRMRQLGYLAAQHEVGAVSLCREILTEISGWRSLADVQKHVEMETEP
jgi:phage terminase Nu1 subunit (DNA packaging protein)